MAKTNKTVEIPAAEAKYILEEMFRDGRVNNKMLDEYRARFVAEVRSLEDRLAKLRSLSGTIAPLAVAAAAGAAAPAAVRAARRAAPKVKARLKKSKAALTPERLATQKLQGRYLGLMRQIPKNVVKARFGKEAIKSHGKEAVVADMEKYLAEKK